ncbi:VanZ family protein [Methanosarcina sp. Mfa9]|uniref:VanZ family protein n=1 Tax=Methanosarcina sp. Mfa9 TaxID=3439063 RepID=UPI003F850943
MSKIKKTSIFTLVAVSYAVLIFYLSVTSDLGDLKHFLVMTLGYKTRDALVENNLSFIKDFLLETLRYVTGLSIDPAHLAVYFVFGVLLYLAFSNSKNPSLVKYPAICSIGTGTAYGILNEIIQMYLPFRVASMADVISNFIGLAIAQVLAIVFVLGLKGISKGRDTQ